MAVTKTGADGDQQRRRRPTTTKGFWEGSASLFTGGDSVIPCQGRDWSRSCPKLNHCAQNFT
jgi:hypothetical protein